MNASPPLPLSQRVESAPATAPASAFIVPLALMALLFFCALRSDGFFEADELAHFMSARTARGDARALVDIWSRIGCTALYSIVAPFGLTAARILSVFVSGLVGLGMTVLVRALMGREDAAPQSLARRHAVALAWLFLFAQPPFLMNGFTVMTELLLACTWIWAAAVLALHRDKPGRGMVLAGALVGLGGLMRPEGWIAVLAWPMFAWIWDNVTAAGPAQGPGARLWKRWLVSCVLAIAPTLAWYLLGVMAWGDWGWVALHWPWRVVSQYGTTGGAFLLSALVSQAGWMWLALGVAAFFLLRGSRATAALRRERRWLLLWPVGGFFFMHAALGAFGLFGSMSMARYFLCVGPFAAVLCVLGVIQWQESGRGNRRGWFWCAVLAALATPIALIFAGILPVRKNIETLRQDLVIAEIRRTVPADQLESRIISWHPYVDFELGLSPHSAAYKEGTSAQIVRNAPAGTIVLTDSQLWFYEGRPTPEQLRAWGYQMDEALAAKVDALTAELQQPLDTVPGRVRIWRK